MNPCDLPYTPCRDPENEVLRMEVPIRIETPWLKISKIKLKKYGYGCSYRHGKHRLTFYFEHGEAPEYIARVTELDRPPLDAPSDSKNKYVQTIVGQLRINMKAWMAMLSAEDIDHIGTWRQSIEMNGQSIKVGDKLKWNYNILGYGPKCLRLNTYLPDNRIILQHRMDGEVKEKIIGTPKAFFA